MVPPLQRSTAEIQDTDCKYKRIGSEHDGGYVVCENHIAHRDLKPHNILVDKEGRTKITDFNVSKMGNVMQYLENPELKDLKSDLEPFLMNTKAGTVQYRAPEMFTSRNYS